VVVVGDTIHIAYLDTKGQKDYVAVVLGARFVVFGLLFVLSGVQHYFEGQ
jgi:hypothetical protein